MAAVPHSKPIEATNKLILAALKAEPKPNEAGKHVGYCPVHETVHSNPSLLIYENASGYLGFSCLSRKCDNKDIVTAIKTKFGLAVPYPAKKIESTGTVNKIINYPAHEPSLPLKYRKPGDIIYEYHCETGEVAFIVQRWEENGKKDIRPFFSKTFMSDDGISQKDWDPTDPPKKERPLYNLHNLYKHNKKPVIIVEGEKTAEAALAMLELKDYVITTWSGGTGAHKFTDWKPLRDRDTSIYFWPDNDAAGVKALREILAKLSNGFKDNRFFILDYSKIGIHDVAQGWDLADESASPECPYSIEEMLEAFQPYSTDSITEVGSLEEEMDKRDKQYRKLISTGKTIVIDITKPNENELYQHQWYKDCAALCSIDVSKVFVPREKGEGTKPIWLAQHWYENYGTTNILHGLVFNPLKDDRIISNGPQNYLNTFTGFPDFGPDNDDTRLASFFQTHVTSLLEEPSLAKWLFDYFAHIFQRPAEKPGVAVILEGGQATGKSSIHLMVSSVLGTRLSRVMDTGLSKWSGSLASSLMLVYDEFSVNMHDRAGKEYYNFLKNLITAPRVSIHEKYVSDMEMDSYHRLVFTTNDAEAIKLPDDDRRFVILRTNYHWHNKLEHFKEMRALLKEQSALAGFKHWLLSRKITSDLSIAPMTQAKEELLHSESRILDELITWANGEGLPSYLRNILPFDESRKFGIEPLLLSRRLVREYFERNGLKSYYTKKEIARLIRVFETENSHIKKKCITIVGQSYREDWDLAFTVPKLEVLRRRLEREAKFQLRWSEASIEGPAESDTTNVIELAKKDVI